MTRVERAVALFASLSILACAVIFITLFPASPWDQFNSRVILRAEAAHLPEQRDAYAPPAAPAFLAGVTASDISLTSMTPEPRVLLRRQAENEHPLASLTKLMTAYVVLEHNPDWNHEITFTQDDVRGGAHTPLAPGAAVSVGDLWKLSLIASDNDATAALAASTGLSSDQFAQAMNDTAARFGFTEMHFAEPTGLSPNNIASARDFAAFARMAFAEPMIRDTVALPETQVTVSGATVRVLSSDQLLKFHAPNTDGWSFIAAKTGFVDESGYNVALLARTTNGQDMLLVLLDSRTVDTRASEADQLLAWGANILQKSE